jgi:superfamily II DNA/RNA helicase
VLDEVDTLVDDSFKAITSELLAKLRKKLEQQLIFAGATFPSNLNTSLGHIIDTEDLEIIQTRHLHRVLPNVYQKIIKPPKVGRLDYLLDVIEPDVDKQRKVLIFCNKSSTAA